MFYKGAFAFIKGVIYLINGKPIVENKDKLPEGNYILAGPHRTWWDPLVFAIAAEPKEFTFMAKKELFSNRLFAWVLDKVNVFPVDRDNPGPSAIKRPVKALKNSDLSLIMFPSGTRHSDDMKGGIALIAKMAKVPIVPVVYEGPLTMKDVFKRRKMTVRFGDPIDTSDVKKLDEAGIHEVEQRMVNAFNQLYSSKEKAIENK